MKRKEKPTIKRLTRHGRSWAIVIDKGLLQAAKLKPDAYFQLSLNPNGGLLIQSINDDQRTSFEKHYQDLSFELASLMQKLSLS
jgi:hypothetical protein